MNDLHHIGKHRRIDDEAPTQEPSTPPPTMPARHVLMLVKRAVRASEQGDFQGTITELCHAVFAGTFKGAQGVSEHEMILALRGVAGFGFPWDDPDRDAA